MKSFVIAIACAVAALSLSAVSFSYDASAQTCVRVGGERVCRLGASAKQRRANAPRMRIVGTTVRRVASCPVYNRPFLVNCGRGLCRRVCTRVRR